jgi:hypothetical protein
MSGKVLSSVKRSFESTSNIELMIAERTTEAFNGRVAVLSSQAGSRGQSAIHSSQREQDSYEMLRPTA